MILKAMRVLIMLKLQLKDTKYALESKLIDLLTHIKPLNLWQNQFQWLKRK